MFHQIFDQIDSALTMRTSLDFELGGLMRSTLLAFVLGSLSSVDISASLDGSHGRLPCGCVLDQLM